MEPMFAEAPRVGTFPILVKDRRLQGRVPLRSLVSLRNSTLHRLSESLDLSPTGLCAAPHFEAMLGMVLHGQFFLPGNCTPITCDVVVVRQDERSGEIGLRFVGLSSTARTQILAYVNAQSAIPTLAASFP